MYLGLNPSFKGVPATLVWGSAEHTGPRPEHSDEAVIELSLPKLEQWRSSSVLQRSCAINTLAHELSHTIPQSQNAYVYQFTDRGRPWASFMNRALASYTLGTVAQCTYLQIEGSPEGADLRMCVEKWGTSKFLGCTTSD